MQAEAVLVRNLSVSYRTFQAVKEISFSIPAGEIFGLLGPKALVKARPFGVVDRLILW